MTITCFSIEYDAINSKSIFTNGDTMSGRIIAEVSKETKIQALMFIASGKAQVFWTEHYSQYDTRIYWEEEKYYEVEQCIREEGVIGKGRHVFPFTFKIPDKKMASSFKDSVCKIVHKVKAELKRSMRLTEKAKQHFTFVSNPDMDIPQLMDPQHGTKDKESLFVSGSVSLDVHTSKMGYFQGEDLVITTEVNNKYESPIQPKYELYEKKSYFAQGHRKVETTDVLKDQSDSVPAGSEEVVLKTITVPKHLPTSITNCNIFKLEYRLKVTLDIKYTTDPKVKLPIVIMKSKEPPKGQPDLRMCGSYQPNQPVGIPNQPFGYPAPPGGFPNQPPIGPTPPIVNPCQPNSLMGQP